MAETPYLVDSNVLLRWVKPDHRDYPAIVSATDAILRHDGVLCYTSQNVGEFWNACTRPLDRNGYGLSPQETDRLAKFFEEKLSLLPDSLAVSLGARFCPNYRTQPWLQATDPISRQRSHWHRAEPLMRLRRLWKVCRPGNYFAS
jgi:hypothetical protein